jgi:hypothetical protein
VAVVGAAAAAEDAQAGQSLRELAVGRGQLCWVTLVERLRFVELGVAQLRGIGADASQPSDPRRVGLERAGEVGGVCAVEHEVGGSSIRLGIHLLDRLTERLAAGSRPSVSTVNEMTTGSPALCTARTIPTASSA